MRTPNSSDIFYVPGIVPDDPKQLKRFLQDELAKISVIFNLLALGHLSQTHVAPVKPRDGDIRYADGTNWQPNGSGAKGVWYFNGTTWVQLG